MAPSPKPLLARKRAAADALIIRDIGLVYGEEVALRGINLTVREEFVSIVGPSGCGKQFAEAYSGAGEIDRWRNTAVRSCR